MSSRCSKICAAYRPRRSTSDTVSPGRRFEQSPLPALYATLLSSESIASSRIEGVREDPGRVLLAGIDDSLVASQSAVLINRNIDAVRQAVEALSATTPWAARDIDALHTALLPDEGAGFRRRMVWISGSSPVKAKYVAPLPEFVPQLMDDLVAYLETSAIRRW